MGTTAEVFLVSVMHRIRAHCRRLAALVGLLYGTSLAAAPVKAEDYDAFWLWGGVALQPVIERANSLYILQGRVGMQAADRRVHLVSQGIPMPHIRHGQVWVVYRADSLRWPEAIYPQILKQLQRWRAAGNPVVGVQIDFDARTRYLDEYVAFLRDLRQRLPADYRLSITGLLDWSSNADPTTIRQLDTVIDEVVVQTYQGRHSIVQYPAYLPRLRALGLPYKIGIIQGGEWQAPQWLQEDPKFGGYVVFLQNP